MQKTFYSLILHLLIAIPPLAAKDDDPNASEKQEKGAIGIGLDVSQEAKLLPGASVLRIIPGLPAFQAGMQPGDIITKISDKAVTSEEMVPKIIANTPVGNTTYIEVKRQEKLLTLKVKIISRTHIEARGLTDWVKKKAPPLFVTSDSSIYPIADLKAEDAAPIDLLAEVRKPILIMVWATWCVACKQVMPWMDKLAEQNAGKFHPVLISNETADVTTPFFKKLPEGKYTNLDFRETDQGRLHIAYWVDSLPTIIVIDSSGVIKYVTNRFSRPVISKHLGI